MNDWFKAMSGAIRRGVRTLPNSRADRGEGIRAGAAGYPSRRSGRSRTERITLSIDPRRAQSYRIAVGAPSIWSDRPMERGWGRPGALFEHLVTNMGVPAVVAAEKIADLERTGGPISFESKRP
ncbi:MAG: hypothetical protein M3167_04000 [Acidobacteriota bacterium]|nr:hypothetical protein [Acidobacteriota bacterium]